MFVEVEMLQLGVGEKSPFTKMKEGNGPQHIAQFISKKNGNFAFLSILSFFFFLPSISALNGPQHIAQFTYVRLFVLYFSSKIFKCFGECSWLCDVKYLKNKLY